MINSEALKEARKKAGHNQAEAAVSIGVSASTLALLESINKQPKHKSVIMAIKSYIKKYNI